MHTVKSSTKACCVVWKIHKHWCSVYLESHSNQCHYTKPCLCVCLSSEQSNLHVRHNPSKSHQKMSQFHTILQLLNADVGLCTNHVHKLQHYEHNRLPPDRVRYTPSEMQHYQSVVFNIIYI